MRELIEAARLAPSATVLAVEIGRRIEGQRRRLGLSQSRVSELVAVDPSAVGRWERGERMPKFAHLYHLAEVFGVALRDLLPGEHEV